MACLGHQQAPGRTVTLLALLLSRRFGFNKAPPAAVLPQVSAWIQRLAPGPLLCLPGRSLSPEAGHHSWCADARNVLQWQQNRKSSRRPLWLISRTPLAMGTHYFFWGLFFFFF